MNQSLFLESRNLFNNPPVPYEDFDNAHNYDELFGAEKYAYNTYLHYIRPYLTDTKNKTIFDINCGKGYALSTLKSHYGFKKCIGYNSIQNMLEACKNRHSNVQFYRDFIMSKQKDADYIFSIEAFDNYNNQSALLLRLRQALASNGYLIIVQSTTNEKVLLNNFSILEKTHGLKSLYHNEISHDVFTAVERISERSPILSMVYADYQTKFNYNTEYKIHVKVLQNV